MTKIGNSFLTESNYWQSVVLLNFKKQLQRKGCLATTKKKMGRSHATAHFRDQISIKVPLALPCTNLREDATNRILSVQRMALKMWLLNKKACLQCIRRGCDRGCQCFWQMWFKCCAEFQLVRSKNASFKINDQIKRLCAYHGLYINRMFRRNKRYPWRKKSICCTKISCFCITYGAYDKILFSLFVRSTYRMLSMNAYMH